MFIIQNLLFAVAKVLDLILTVYLWIVLARAVLSWVNPDPRNAIVQLIHRATEPILFWVRSRLPVYFGGVDLSTLVVILVIYFLKLFLVQTIFGIAGRMG